MIIKGIFILLVIGGFISGLITFVCSWKILYERKSQGILFITLGTDLFLTKT